ncbi:hypothetical protein WJX74_003979 [Apatococcus lobatus]|uniref:AP2/ERF domain-containing protein n=1 Tax=Apatococcus lobatus TaxID=904363 RepID=A0AAW1QM18_9CHLO
MQCARRAGHYSSVVASSVQSVLQQETLQAVAVGLLCSRSSADSRPEQHGLKTAFASCSFSSAICHLASLQQAEGSSLSTQLSVQCAYASTSAGISQASSAGSQDGPKDRKESQSSSPTQQRTASGYRGVSWKAIVKRWESRVRHDSIAWCCGYWPSPEEAAEAWDRAAICVQRPDKWLNFPDRYSQDERRRLQQISLKDLSNTLQRSALPKTSRYRGVSWSKAANKWNSSLKHDLVQWNFGHWFSPEEAAEAYDRAAICVQRPDWQLNFPDRYSQDERRQLQQTSLKVLSHTLRLSSFPKTSRYPGVSLMRKTGKWYAQLFSKNRKYNLGYWRTEVGAAKAVDQARICLGGNPRMLSFSAKEYPEDLLLMHNTEAHLLRGCKAEMVSLAQPHPIG